ncbi:oxidoreductase-like protein [Pochonia chlamydosporia 170]|uniref:Oxidoreductase-like protein n=1 Tax=Pochonia chlamydosporia 170 TaxID=1380566 RepID=A0A179F577_METCM|nr:oxidoreductase-like protein [Pochonia chlamydosporia 170]OAQ60575.2 oxidoreductase-like protein [Pochonia chlamydosporia 170]
MSFGSQSTATEVAVAFGKYIRGKTVLMTGVSPESIGEATAHAIASQQPARLFLASRTRSNIDSVANNIRAKFPATPLHPLLLDLSSQTSVRQAAAEFNASASKLDILINNAGIMAVAERTLSVDGIELQFATNHIGHFLFTNLILDKMRVAAKESEIRGATRIINISSNGHRFSPVRFNDWNFEGKDVPIEQQPDVEKLMGRIGSINWTNGYEKFVAYGQSKTANILFSLYLRENLGKGGILSFSVHPGTIGTNLIRNMFTDIKKQEAAKLSMRPESLVGSYKSIDGGASTSIFAAFDQCVDGTSSIYLEDCSEATPAPHANDVTLAHKLWTLSETLVGQEFTL